tara:strand:+ start:730 stop:912 length:183 start_codon:yes stop_codon:yes gene_type:complete
MENSRMVALRDFVLGKERIAAGDPVDCDADCMAKLVHRGFVGQGTAKKKAAKKKATSKGE